MKTIVTTAILLLIFSILLTGCSTNAQHVVDISNENLVLRNKIDELEKEVIRLNNEIKELTEVKVGLEESIKVLEISERTTMDESLEENKVLNINKYYDLLNEPLSISKDSQYYLKQKLDGNYNFKHLDTTLVKVFDFIHSFNKLTEKTISTLSQEEIISIGNIIDQELIAANLHLDVNIGLVEINYILKKMNYELSIKYFEDNEITLQELESAKESYVLIKTGQGDGSVSYFSHLSTIPLLTPVNLLICLTESPSLRSFLMQLFLTLISKS